MVRIRVALVGAGLSGQVFHAPFILGHPDLFDLRTVIELDPPSPRGTIGDKFGIMTKVSEHIVDALNDPNIDLVIIATPSHLHFGMAKAALNANKHVVIDKPVTTTLAEATELGELAESRNLILTGFQNRRWDSDFMALRKLLADGLLGELVDFESHSDWLNPVFQGTWRENRSLPGSSYTFDLGSHLIDQALQLFGRPSTITASISQVRGMGEVSVDDYFIIEFHYSNKPLHVLLRASLLSIRNPQLRFIVRGTKGTFTKYDRDPQETQLLGGMKSGDPLLGWESDDLAGTLETLGESGVINTKRIPSVRGDYGLFYQNLAKAIHRVADLAVKWQDASQVIEMIELAHISASMDTTVDVPPWDRQVESQI